MITYNEGDVLYSSSHVQYEIRKVLEGGMGKVLISFDNNWQRLVALKTFKDEYLSDDNAVAGLKREALKWILLEPHTNIVYCHKVIEIFQRLYIVMEYVAGGDLYKHIPATGMDTAKMLDFSIQFCNGMEAVQKCDAMIHCDIKPANILIKNDLDGVVCITDFGLAKSLYTQELGGMTPEYASPEQFLSENLDTRTDIYSFGVVMYEMITGRRPFLTKYKEDYSRLHTTVEPNPPRTYNNSMPENLQEIIFRCLEKQPKNRFQSFTTLKKNLIELYEELFDSPYEEKTIPITDWQSHYGLRGKAFYTLGQYEAAIQCFDESIAQDPDNLLNCVALCGKANSYAKIREFDKALQCFHEAIDINPNDETPYGGLAELMYNRGEAEKAITYAQKAVELNPKYMPGWNIAGMAFESLQRFDDALYCYDKCIDINRTSPEPWNNKGLIYLFSKRYREALNFFTTALEFNPRFSLAWMNRGLCYFMLEEDERAIECFDKAIRLDQKNAKAWHNKGLVYKEHKMYKDAMNCFQIAYQIDPYYVDTILQMAQLYSMVNQLKDAIKCYDAILEIEPNNQEIIAQRNEVLRQI